MKSFLSSREHMSQASVKIPAAESPNGGLTKVTSDPNGPQVELLTEKGVVQKIVITCKCGERVVLNCEY